MVSLRSISSRSSSLILKLVLLLLALVPFESKILFLSYSNVFRSSCYRKPASPENFRVLECFSVFISLRKFRYVAPESSLKSEPVRDYPGKKRRAAVRKGRGKRFLLKILIQSTPVTVAYKRNPVDAGRALIKESLMVMAKLPIVLSLLRE